MLNKVPNPRRMAKHIVLKLGTKGALPLSELTMQLMRPFSFDLLEAVKSSVETTVLELDYRGVLRICDADCVRLTENGQAWAKQLMLKNARRSATDSRQNVIRKKRAESKMEHSKTADELADLGRLLGRGWRKEYALVAGGPVILDEVWYELNGRSSALSESFEIQHRGSLKNAIHNLEAAHRYHPSCKLYLVIHDGKELTKAQQLLGATLNRSIAVISAASIDNWHKALTTPLGKMAKSERRRIFDVRKQINDWFEGATARPSPSLA